MIYSIFYALIRIVSFFKVKGRLWVVFFSVLLIVLAGFRSPDVSDDYYNYIFYYQLAEASDGFSLSFPAEPGFYFLSKISGLILSNYTLLFFGFAVLGVGIKACVFNKYAKFPLVSLLLYFSFYYFQFEFAHIRVGVAIAILYWFYFKALDTNNAIWVLFGIALAMTFHYSSFFFVFALLSIWLSKSRFSLIALVSCLLLSIALIGLYYLGFGVKSLVRVMSFLDFTGKLNYYLDGLDEGVLNRINILNRLGLHFVALAFLVLGYRKIKDMGGVALLHLYAFGVLFFCVFAEIPVLAYRLSDIFLFSSVFAVPLVLVINPKLLSRAFVFCFSLTYFVVMVFFSGNEVDYKMFF